MSASVPDWLAPPPQFELPAWLAPPPQVSPPPVKIPDWLSAHTKREFSPLVTTGKSKEHKALLFQQFEMVFPRVIDRMCGGDPLTTALGEIPFAVDRGAFMTWVKKDAQRYALFKEAKEVRTEVWAGEMIEHAKGEHLQSAELDRAKFIVDTLKFLIRADNKKEYGETKQIEVTQTISITAALEAAQSRVERVIEAELVDDDPMPLYRQLSSSDDEYGTDED